MSKSILVLTYGFLLSSLVACSEIDSEDVRTSGFNMDAQITTTDSSTNILVRLKAGDDFDSDRIVLTAGDQLRADLSGRRLEVPRLNDAYRASYENVTGGEVLTLELLRPEGVSAFDTRVLLPDSFEINAPDQGASFNAGDTITVAWSPGDPGNTMEVRYSVDCPLVENTDSFHAGRIGRTFDAADIGTHTTTVNTILNAFDDQDEFVTGIPCPLSITLTRENTGTLDSALDGGSIDAKHRQIVTGTVIP